MMIICDCVFVISKQGRRTSYFIVLITYMHHKHLKKEFQS